MCPEKLNKCQKCGSNNNESNISLSQSTVIICDEPQACSSIMESQCLIYTGNAISCFDDIIVPTNTDMNTAINSIVEYLCFKTTLQNNILCNSDVVVEADTPIDTALATIISYFCNTINQLATVTVIEGAGINVTTTVVGNNTEYQITNLNPTPNSYTGPKKFVKQFTNVIFDDITLTILGTELATCGLYTTACGVNTIQVSDFTYNIMYLFNGVWISLTNETGVSLTTNDNTGDIFIRLNIAPIDPGVTVRVTIIG